MTHIERTFGVFSARTVRLTGLSFNAMVMNHLKGKSFAFLQIFAGRALIVTLQPSLGKKRYRFEVWTLTDSLTSVTQRSYSEISWHEAGVLIADNS